MNKRISSLLLLTQLLLSLSLAGNYMPKWLDGDLSGNIAVTSNYIW